MKKLMLLLAFGLLTACAPGFETEHNVPEIDFDAITYFPVASAEIGIFYDQQSLVSKRTPRLIDLIIPQSIAQVAQGSATVSVTYNNPSVISFSVNTSSLGNSVTVNGDELNLGSLSVATLDDNTIRVCTGVGAPANRCNRLFIRVYTLGTASGGITGTAGFINTEGLYGIPVTAGSVTTPLGFNSSPTASSVSGAAVVYTYTIPNGTNRVRLNQLSVPSIPIKADLSNAGNGPYEMNLVVQYALGYVP